MTVTYVEVLCQTHVASLWISAASWKTLFYGCCVNNWGVLSSYLTNLAKSQHSIFDSNFHQTEAIKIAERRIHLNASKTIFTLHTGASLKHCFSKLTRICVFLKGRPYRADMTIKLYATLRLHLAKNTE